MNISSIFFDFDINEIQILINENRMILMEKIINYYYTNNFNLTTKYSEIIKQISDDILFFIQTPYNIEYTEHCRYLSSEIFMYENPSRLISLYNVYDVDVLDNFVSTFFKKTDKYILNEYLKFYSYRHPELGRI